MRIGSDLGAQLNNGSIRPRACLRSSAALNLMAVLCGIPSYQSADGTMMTAPQSPTTHALSSDPPPTAVPRRAVPHTAPQRRTRQCPSQSSDP